MQFRSGFGSDSCCAIALANDLHSYLSPSHTPGADTALDAAPVPTLVTPAPQAL